MAYFVVGVQIETEFLITAASAHDAQLIAQAKVKGMIPSPDRILITKVEKVKEDTPKDMREEEAKDG